ncbi:hypothetical protein TNCV_1600131 [Trichonephila clavipes]|nr:hypothetical protein TNCV_1600131 [Trichonephila clavipes]
MDHGLGYPTNGDSFYGCRLALVSRFRTSPGAIDVASSLGNVVSMFRTFSPGYLPSNVRKLSVVIQRVWFLVVLPLILIGS